LPGSWKFIPGRIVGTFVSAGTFQLKRQPGLRNSVRRRIFGERGKVLAKDSGAFVGLMR
jgi:hypothetical protein